MRSYYGLSGAGGAPGGRAQEAPRRRPPSPRRGSFDTQGGAEGEGGGATRAEPAEGANGPRSPERSKAERRGPRAPGAHGQRAQTAENGRGPLIVTGTPPKVFGWPSCEVWSQKGGRYARTLPFVHGFQMTPSQAYRSDMYSTMAWSTGRSISTSARPRRSIPWARAWQSAHRVMRLWG